MKLSELLTPQQVIAELHGRSKPEVMEELCRPIVDLHPQLNLSHLLKVLAERERLGSTGIGDGVAIPHGKLAGIDQLLVSFGRSREGVDFDSLDGKPAHLFFLVLAPENLAGVHLKALACISRLLKSYEVRDRLMAAADENEILEILASQEEEF